MLFSDHFGLTLTGDEDWFDPILSIDTRLFIDPFLIFKQEFDHFIGSHTELMGYFNSIYLLVAKSGGDPSQLSYKRALALLSFPEAAEFCLGFVGTGTRGSGSGSHFARLMAEAVTFAVRSGALGFTHFEEVGLLQEGIGADRISDATATILKHRFVNYTTDICVENEIPVKEFRHPRGFYNRKTESFEPVVFHLPVNPLTEQPVLLSPRCFLRELPTINAGDFWNYCRTNENDLLRTELNSEIIKNVRKGDIIEVARKHPELRARYLRGREQTDAQPYDFAADKEGLVQWYGAAKEHTDAFPLQFQIVTEQDFETAIEDMVLEFKHYVEQNSGWKLLFREDDAPFIKPRKESATQLLCYGVIRNYCKANDIDVTREADLGRGPVDFKVSKGYKLRALIEVKLVKNTKFWAGLERQLPTYLVAEQVKLGYFMAVVYNDKEAEKVSDIQQQVEKVARLSGKRLRAIIIDARPEKPSASKL